MKPGRVVDGRFQDGFRSTCHDDDDAAAAAQYYGHGMLPTTHTTSVRPHPLVELLSCTCMAGRPKRAWRGLGCTEWAGWPERDNALGGSPRRGDALAL